MVKKINGAKWKLKKKSWFQFFEEKFLKYLCKFAAKFRFQIFPAIKKFFSKVSLNISRTGLSVQNLFQVFFKSAGTLNFPEVLAQH